MSPRAARPAAPPSPAEISVDLIDPAEDNPRLDVGDVAPLADSIRELGILQPLLVQPKGDRFLLVCGHRRLAAAKVAGLSAVPATVVVDEDDRRRRARMIVENIHRRDLTALEESRAYRDLLGLGVDGGQRGLAQLVGMSQGHVSKRIALLKLPDEVLAEVDSGGITVSDALELTKLADPDRVKKALAERTWYGGGIAGAVHRIQQDLDREKAQTAEIARLKAAGVTFVEDSRPWGEQHDRVPISWLVPRPAGHEKLRCHAVTVEHNGIVELCLDPASHHGAAGEDEGPVDDEARAERLAQFEVHQAAIAAARAIREAAQARRRAFVAELVQSGKTDEGPALLLTHWLFEMYELPEASDVARILGLVNDTFNDHGEVEALRAYVAKGTRNASRALYAMAIAAGESLTGHWMAGDEAIESQRVHLRHLAARGYELEEAEQLVLQEADEEADADVEATG